MPSFDTKPEVFFINRKRGCVENSPLSLEPVFVLPEHKFAEHSRFPVTKHLQHFFSEERSEINEHSSVVYWYFVVPGGLTAEGLIASCRGFLWEHKKERV